MITLANEKTSNKVTRRTIRSLNLYVVILVPLILFLGLNSFQLFSNWVIWKETRRLESLAMHGAEAFQNPSPVADYFSGKLSSDFWIFSIINGAGKVSRENAFHSASITFDDVLTIRHSPDPAFREEDSFVLRKPAAGQYNNVSLIGGSGFRPTPSTDVVLKFKSRVGDGFYGTAGVIFQPEDTLRENGLFAKPFDMFGFSVVGDSSNVMGTNGPICYLALDWMPVQVNSLQVDPHAWHSYELRLQWFSQTEWRGIVKVDQVMQCQLSMPAFGPVEVHVWSDNSLAIQKPQRWWEIAPALEFKFENGGEKIFQLDDIRISASSR